jgi:putative mRNA 3-end processing factor
MKFKFFGGAEEIGSLGVLLEFEKNKLLVEYGITPTKPPSYPIEAPNVDAILLTHAHLDHSGMIPFQSNKYNIPIYLTAVTRDLARLLFYDTVKVADLEGFFSPYNNEDLEAIEDKYQTIAYNKSFMIKETEITGHSAGHIPGSTMYMIDNSQKILFTGDLQTIDTELLKGCKNYTTDTLFIESTYAGKEHPPREKTEREFLGKIEEVLDRKGKVIIPAFAVGRTQEVMLVLKKLDREFFVDGMSNTVNHILKYYPGYLKDAKEFNDVRKLAKPVSRKRDRKLAIENGVIITTSGMLEGGPVLGYLSQTIDDPKNAILFTGYQVENTNGRMLLETGIIDLYGVRSRVMAEIHRYDFSSHASHSQLVKFINSSKAENVVLCHGDHREALAEDLDKNVILPLKGEVYEIKD